MQSAQFQLHADIEERHWWFVARREVFRRLIASLVPPGQGHLVVDVGVELELGRQRDSSRPGAAPDW